MTMLLGILVVVGMMGVCGVLVVLAIADPERRQEKWGWSHPPEDNDDGVTEVKNDDEDSGQ